MSRVLYFLTAAIGLLVVVFVAFYFYSKKPQGPDATTGQARTLNVLAYASFVNSWGPGPEIAKLFRERHGVEIKFQDAGDAGLLLQKLALFPSDVVLGFDQLLLDEARRSVPWRPLKVVGELKYRESDFLAFDWGPLAFVYKQGQLEPPKSLEDLVDPRFKETFALQDPRTSSPGLQFFFWVLDEKGIEEGFNFLEALKPNVQSVSASWSGSYGIFTKGLAKSTFSYQTSPLYHLIEEKDSSFAAAVFAEGHPVQVEYVGIPSKCINCEEAELFLQFLVTPEAQKIIMQKNYMLPVIEGVTTGTPFANLPSVKEREWKNLPELLKKRDELFERWKALNL